MGGGVGGWGYSHGWLVNPGRGRGGGRWRGLWTGGGGGEVCFLAMGC